MGHLQGNVNAVKAKQVKQFGMRIINRCQKCLSFSDTYYKIKIKSGEILAFIRHKLVYLSNSVWTWIYALQTYIFRKK